MHPGPWRALFQLHLLACALNEPLHPSEPLQLQMEFGDDNSLVEHACRWNKDLDGTPSTFSGPGTGITD